MPQIEPAIRYSGRRWKRDDFTGASSQPSIASSPVWPLAVVVFIVACLLHDVSFAISVVVAQLAGMTGLQWLAMLAQRNVRKIGLPLFALLPVMRGIRLGAFWAALVFTAFW